jgi:hypothetical protein
LPAPEATKPAPKPLPTPKAPQPPSKPVAPPKAAPPKATSKPSRNMVRLAPSGDKAMAGDVYLNQIIQWIQRRRKYPEYFRQDGLVGTAAFTMTWARNGEIVDLSLSMSSGDAAIDLYAEDPRSHPDRATLHPCATIVAAQSTNRTPTRPCCPTEPPGAIFAGAMPAQGRDHPTQQSLRH